MRREIDSYAGWAWWQNVAWHFLVVRPVYLLRRFGVCSWAGHDWVRLRWWDTGEPTGLRFCARCGGEESEG